MKFGRGIIISLILVAVILIAGCTGKGAIEESPKSNIFTNQEWGYSFEIPQGWEISPTYKSGNWIIINPPSNDHSQITIRSYAELNKKPISSFTLDEAIDYYQKYYPGWFDPVTEKNDITVGGVPAKFYYQRNTDKYVLLIKDNSIHVIIYLPKKDNYNKYLKDFDTVVNSFKFI